MKTSHKRAPFPAVEQESRRHGVCNKSVFVKLGGSGAAFDTIRPFLFFVSFFEGGGWDGGETREELIAALAGRELRAVNEKRPLIRQPINSS